MPQRIKGESKKEYMNRCIPILVKEGKEQDQAIAICSDMYDKNYKEDTHMWLEIFRTGTHTSSEGIVKTYTGIDLQKIADTYNAQKDHEAPIVVGHPETDHPAYGWVKELKVGGEKLMAFVDQVNDWAKDAVAKGMFKKISIALYGDGLLRHVGLLGATPPAVKGLAPVKFGEDKKFEEFETAVEERNLLERLFEELKGFFSTAQQKTKQEEDNMAFEKEIKELTESFGKKFDELTGLITGLTAKVDAVEKEAGTLKTSFAEQSKIKTDQEKAVKFEESVTSFDAYCEELAKAGKILPAEKEGFVEQYKDLLKAEDGVTFAQSEKKFTEKFKESLGKRQPLFTEQNKKHFATKDKADDKKIDGVPAEFSGINPNKIDPSGLELHKQISAYAETNKISYEEAAAKVMAG